YPSKAVFPLGTTTPGSISSIVIPKYKEQLKISSLVGVPLLPFSCLGLHKTVFVIKICSLFQPILLISDSNMSPVRSPHNGIPVRSAPKRPGASAIKRTLEFIFPFKSDNTLVLLDNLGHIEQY